MSSWVQNPLLIEQGYVSPMVIVLNRPERPTFFSPRHASESFSGGGADEGRLTGDDGAYDVGGELGKADFKVREGLFGFRKAHA